MIRYCWFIFLKEIKSQMFQGILRLHFAFDISHKIENAFGLAGFSFEEWEGVCKLIGMMPMPAWGTSRIYLA